MRVLQLVQSRQRRGAEVFAFELSTALEDEGHESSIVYLYHRDGEGSLPLRPQDHSLDARNSHPFEKVPGWHPRLLHGLGKVIQAYAPDVVQLNGGRTLKYGALLRRFRPGADWVTVYRNIGNPQDWLGKGIRRAVYRRLVCGGVDGIVAVSRASFRQLDRVYSFEGPTAVIPTGARLDGNGRPAEAARVERRISLDTPEHANVMLFVGSLTREKRPDRLLEVFRRVVEALPETFLWVVGEGPEVTSLRDHVSRHGLDGQVRMTGSVSSTSPFLRAADVLVLTSDTEGIPAVILEAGLAGLPVVSTRVGSVDECVLDGETGYLVDPRDVEAFAGRVVELLHSDEKRRNLGGCAREWISAHFGMPTIADRYTSFYTRVCQGGGMVRSARVPS